MSSGPEDSPGLIQPTEAMCAAFWASRSREYRLKWAKWMQKGLSPKRRYQLGRHMTEFFARQEGPMEDVAKAKRAEYEKLLQQNYHGLADARQQAQTCENNIKQIQGALKAIDDIFGKKAEANGPPKLSLVPKLELQPELKNEGAASLSPAPSSPPNEPSDPTPSGAA